MTFEGRPIDLLPTGGFNNGLSPLRIGERQCPIARNVRFGENDVQKREGSSRIVTGAVAASPISGIFELAKDDGTLDVVAFAGTAVSRKNGSAWSSCKGAVAITDATTWRGAVLAGVLVCTNDTDALISYAGGATNFAALGGTPPQKARDIAEYHNYHLYLNVQVGGVRRRARVMWSDLNNPASHTSTNFNDLINQGGQFGVAFGAIGDQLYAFLSGSIHQISYTGDDVTPFTFVRAAKVGAVSKHAVVEVDGRIFFAGKKGVYMFDGGKPQYIGKPVEGFWRTINKSRLANIVAGVNEARNEVMFSISTGSESTNTLTLVYDYEADKWAPDDGYAPTYWASLEENYPLQPVFGNATGLVLQINTGAYLDDAAAITAYFRTRPNDFGDPGRKRKARELIAVVDTSSQGDATITFRDGYDLAVPSGDDAVSIFDTGAVYDTAIFDTDIFAGEGQIIVTHRPTGHGRYYQAEVRNAQASVPMSVSELTAMVKGEAGE